MRCRYVVQQIEQDVVTRSFSDAPPEKELHAETQSPLAQRTS